jgi:hypothetical protein
MDNTREVEREGVRGRWMEGGRKEGREGGTRALKKGKLTATVGTSHLRRRQ